MAWRSRRVLERTTHTREDRARRFAPVLGQHDLEPPPECPQEGRLHPVSLIARRAVVRVRVDQDGEAMRRLPLPANREIAAELDLAAQRVEMALPEGLTDL